MSNQQSEIKKKLWEERNRQLAEEEAARVELLQLASSSIPLKTPAKDESVNSTSQPIQYEFSSGESDVEKSLLDNFDAQFGTDKREGSTLHFETDEQAEQFFRDQADKGHAFCYYKQGEDKIAFSDGQGNFKLGTRDEISNFCDDKGINSPFQQPSSSLKL